MRSLSWSNGAGSSAAGGVCVHAVAQERNDLGTCGERRLELVAHRVVGALDAAPSIAVARVQIVRRDEDEQDRRCVQRLS